MPKSKSRRKNKSSRGSSRGGGTMSGIRRSTRNLAGTGKRRKRRPMNFWDVFFWLFAIFALIFVLYRKFS